MLLRFDLFDVDRAEAVVHINPEQVASVVEASRRRSYGGYSDVADIRMADGTVYTVTDHRRDAARRIAEAAADPNGSRG